MRKNQMSSDEVKHATREAYGRYQNNEKLKESFRAGFRDGSQ